MIRSKRGYERHEPDFERDKTGSTTRVCGRMLILRSYGVSVRPNYYQAFEKEGKKKKLGGVRGSIARSARRGGNLSGKRGVDGAQIRIPRQDRRFEPRNQKTRLTHWPVLGYLSAPIVSTEPTYSDRALTRLHTYTYFVVIPTLPIYI